MDNLNEEVIDLTGEEEEEENKTEDMKKEESIAQDKADDSAPNVINNPSEAQNLESQLKSLKYENNLLMRKNNEKKNTIFRLTLAKQKQTTQIAELQEHVKSEASLKQKIEELEKQLAISKTQPQPPPPSPSPASPPAANTSPSSSISLSGQAYAKLVDSLKKQLSEMKEDYQKLKKTFQTKDVDSISTSLNRLEEFSNENREIEYLLNTVRAGVGFLKQEIDVLKNAQSMPKINPSTLSSMVKLQKVCSLIDAEFENGGCCANSIAIEDLLEERVNKLLAKLINQRDVIRECNYSNQKLQGKLRNYEDLEEKYERSKQKRTESDERVENLTAQKNRLLDIVDHYKIKIQSLFDKLKTKNFHLEEKERNIQDLRYESKELKRDLAESRKELERFKFEAKNTKIVSETEHLFNNVKEDRENNNAQLNEKLKTCEQKVNDLENELSKQMAYHWSEKTKMNEEIQNLKSQVDEASQEINEFQRAQKDSIKYTDLLKKQLEQAESDRQNFKSAKTLAGDSESLKNELEKKQFTIKTLYDEKNSLFVALSKEQSAHQTLKDRFSKFDGVLKQIFSAMKNDEDLPEQPSVQPTSEQNYSNIKIKTEPGLAQYNMSTDMPNVKRTIEKTESSQSLQDLDTNARKRTCHQNCI